MQDILEANFEDLFQSYENEVYRIVEGQYFIATRKLVDSDDEHDILEEIIDQSKPAVVTHNSRGKLHYLLYTPFRYPPLRSGGRFHTRIEQSIFYASEKLETAMAEVSYGRLAFLHHSEAKFQPMQVPYTHFVTKVQSNYALLLNRQPFSNHIDSISNPQSYTASQTLGQAMRQRNTELFTYSSARHKNGINVGLFSPEPFCSNSPIANKDRQWSVFISKNTIEFARPKLTMGHTESHVFTRESFYIADKFPIIL